MSQQKLRYHYIDWLRITAFLLLIFYHAARAFFPEDPWHINDPVGSWDLRVAMDLIARWRLPLLFFISGIGTWFVFSRRTLPDFLKNRFIKILLPLLFSMAIIVPPQVWLERVFSETTNLNYFSWYLSDAFTKGTYSEGNISWHHLWYIAYLFTMTMLLLPLMSLYIKGNLPRLSTFWRKLCNGPSIFLIVLIPIIIDNTMGRIWPDKTNALLGDWGWLSLTASWFLIGFLTAPLLASFTKTSIRYRWISLFIWLLLTSVIFFRTGSDDFKFIIGQTVVQYDDMFRIPIAWVAIITLIGFSATLVNKNSKIKRYLNEAIYPLYIIHQTIALALVFFIVPTELAVWQKFIFVTTLTFFLSFIVYNFIIRNLGKFRVLFGLERQK